MFVVTATVPMEKVAASAPPGTTTVAGATALPELLEIATTTPADGAATERVTVPVVGFPPTTDDGFNVTDVILQANMLSVFETPPPGPSAAMRVDLSDETLLVVTRVPAVVAPAGMLRTPNTFASSGLVEDKVTENPPGGAAPFK